MAGNDRYCRWQGFEKQLPETNVKLKNKSTNDR